MKFTELEVASELESSRLFMVQVHAAGHVAGCGVPGPGPQ